VGSREKPFWPENKAGSRERARKEDEEGLLFLRSKSREEGTEMDRKALGDEEGDGERKEEGERRSGNVEGRKPRGKNEQCGRGRKPRPSGPSLAN
jgi:hypothetical protein